jgi:DNA (cytosine-5)-methyltransferase 1
LVSDLKPKFFVFENVKGLTIGGHRRFLHEIIEEFQNRGYKVEARYRVLNAADYGVPQGRQRLFLLGAYRGTPLPSYPAPTHARRDEGTEAMFPNDILPTPTVSEALDDLPDADDFEELFDRDWVFARFGKPSAYAAMLRYPDSRKEGLELLSSSLRTVHTKLSQRRFLETPRGAIEPVSRFLKLDPAGICNTIRAGTASDRGAFTSPRPIHPSSPRCITVREAARLHSYPDWFRFHVTKWHGFRQIGNSVPPLLAQAVAAQMVALLTSRQRPPKPVKVGDPALLSLTMSEAAERYGVPATVIPQRLRKSYEKAYA